MPLIVSACKTIPQRWAPAASNMRAASPTPLSEPAVRRDAGHAPARYPSHQSLRPPLRRWCSVVSGTSLAAVLSTALVSAHTYSSSGCVDLAAAALVSPAAMLTAPLGARLTARLNCTALRRILGFFLLAAAPMVPLKASRAAGDGAPAAPRLLVMLGLHDWRQ